MYVRVLVFASLLCLACCAPQNFETQFFKVGIEYDHSLPMVGGSDRYRHRNNYDPFFVTVSATAKKGYVFSYIEVTATVDEGGKVEFNLIKGTTGSKVLIFQLVSNQSDFLKYSYLAYGMKEAEYKKISNIIEISMPTLPTNHGSTPRLDLFTCVLIIFSYLISLFFIDMF